MKKRELELGDVLQMRADHPKFPGMLVVVTEKKSFGCQGYLLSSRNFEGAKFNGRAFVRPCFEDVEYVGKIVWLEEDDIQKEENVD